MDRQEELIRRIGRLERQVQAHNEILDTINEFRMAILGNFEHEKIRETLRKIKEESGDHVQEK